LGGATAMQAFLQQWNGVGISRLAEYVTHRRATLKLLEKMLSSDRHRVGGARADSNRERRRVMGEAG
jgi:hypothetical protein